MLELPAGTREDFLCCCPTICVWAPAGHFHPTGHFYPGPYGRLSRSLALPQGCGRWVPLTASAPPWRSQPERGERQRSLQERGRTTFLWGRVPCLGNEHFSQVEMHGWLILLFFTSNSVLFFSFSETKPSYLLFHSHWIEEKKTVLFKL